MLESEFQAKLIKKLRKRFEGCIILKNDANYIQGFPDLTIFYKDKYAILECKASEDAHRELNQGYYIDYISSRGAFASFIYPENEEEILDELQQAFGT